MFNRMSALCLVLGVVGGYALASPPLNAQNTSVSPVPPFVQAGDDLTLYFEAGTFTERPYTMRCAVGAVEGLWLRCGPTDPLDVRREQTWLNLDHVIRITKREK